MVKEASTLPFEPGAVPGDRDILARDARRDAVNPREIAGAALADVFEALRLRESRLEEAAAERLDFNLPYRFESRHLEPKVESSDSREKRSVGQHARHFFPDTL